MLRRLVPNGRTRRLAPLVAGMTSLLGNEANEENAVIDALQAAAEAYDSGKISQWLLLDQVRSGLHCLNEPPLSEGSPPRITSERFSLPDNHYQQENLCTRFCGIKFIVSFVINYTSSLDPRGALR